MSTLAPAHSSTEVLSNMRTYGPGASTPTNDEISDAVGVREHAHDHSEALSPNTQSPSSVLSFADGVVPGIQASDHPG